MLKFFKNPFALAGTRASIPATDPGTGEVNYPTGWPLPYQLVDTDPASRKISRSQTNQLMFDITNAIAELQAWGTPDFITTALNEGAPFSYGLGARVRYDDGVNGPRVFVSRVAANTDLPTVAASWAPVRDFTPFAVAGGTANALTATLSPSLGLVPSGTAFLLRHAAVNTGAATLALNGGAAKAIVRMNDLALGAGDIPGAGSWGQYVYDGTLDKYVLLNAEAFASATEAQAWSTLTRALSPGGLNSAFQGTNQLFAANGYQRFPGGLILQWGRNVLAASTQIDVSLPLVFPNSFYTAVGIANTDSMSSAATPFFGSTPIGLSVVRLQNGYSATPIAVGWIAIGR